MLALDIIKYIRPFDDTREFYTPTEVVDCNIGSLVSDVSPKFHLLASVQKKL